MFMGFRAGRVLLQPLTEFQERGVLLAHRASKDQRVLEGKQDHKGPLEMQASWDPSGRKVCLGLAVHQERLDSVESSDKWATLVCKAWTVAVATLVSLGCLVCLVAVSAWDTCW